MQGLDVAEHKNHKIRLIFIINGQDYPIEVSAEAPLLGAVQDALQVSGNTGRPADEWEVRDAKGVLLDKNRTIESLHLHNGARLFLSLRVGAGGIGQNRR